MDYPGIDKIEDMHVFRSVGNRESGGQLGFGFMHKNGKEIDEENAIFRFYSFVYVIRGNGVYLEDSGTQHRISSGSFFQRFPGVRHSTYIDPESNWAECYMDFGNNVYDLLHSLNIINPELPVGRINKELSVESQIYRNIEHLKNRQENQLPDLMIKSIQFLREMLCENPEAEEGHLPPDIIEQSCTDFIGNFKIRYDLKEYCLSKGWGYETFRKHFKKKLGISPGKYIVRRRIDMACQILKSSDKSVGEIAYELGYRSQYEFSAQFKRLIGVSPSNYR